MRWLTTTDAEQEYGIRAETIAKWCRDGRIDSVRKDEASGRWLITDVALARFLDAHPRLRRRRAKRESRSWKAFAAVAAVLKFAIDAVAFRDIIQGGNRTALWILAAVLSLGLWAAAWVILRSKEYTDIRSRYVRLSARIVLWGMPVLLILGLIGFQFWRVIPPRQTIVLVADFVDPTGVDSGIVTRSLVEGMRETLRDHPDIVVKRLKQPIPAEEGSARARRIAEQPEHKAAFVIWGDYTLDPAPELYVHFDIIRQAETYLGSGTYEEYGPAQAQQPSFFDFKLELGPYLGQLTAFASGLALFQADDHKAAIPLFETAAQAIDQSLGVGIERAIRFYRGTNYLCLGRALDAEPDLQELVPDPASSAMIADEAGRAALSNLGLAAMHLGDYVTARHYLERALEIESQLGNLDGQAAALGSLGTVAICQGNYAAAKKYHEQALEIHMQLGDSLGQAADLCNLGVVARLQGNYATAVDYLEQALKIARQFDDPGGQATVLNNLGTMAIFQGDYAIARRYLEQALEIYTQLGNPLGRADSLSTLAGLAVYQEDYAAAKGYLERALEIESQLGDSLGQAKDLGNLGLVAACQGDYATAIDYYERSLETHSQLGYPLGQAEVFCNLGLVAKEQGDYATAIDYLERSAGLYQKMELDLPPILRDALESLTPR